MLCVCVDVHVRACVSLCSTAILISSKDLGECACPWESFTTQPNVEIMSG